MIVLILVHRDRAARDVDAAGMGVFEGVAACARGGTGRAGCSRMADGAGLARVPRRGLGAGTVIGEAARSGWPAERCDGDALVGRDATARAGRSDEPARAGR